MNENRDDMKFEEALSALEEIVSKIESGDLSLDESLELFEKGIALTRLCSSKLENARHRVRKMVEDDQMEDVEI